MEQRENSICFQIKMLHDRFKRVSMEAQDSDPEVAKLTMMQRWTIGFLYHNQDRDIFQKDLEGSFFMARSTVTSNVKQLEKEGYIKRVGVEHDSRLKKLVLLPKGIDIQEKVIDSMDRTEELVRHNLSDTDVESFLKVSRQIRENLGGSGTEEEEFRKSACDSPESVRE